MAASLLEGGNRCILGVLGGGQQGPFWHRADDFDCSTGDRVGAGRNGRGMAWRLCFSKGIFDNIFGEGG